MQGSKVDSRRIFPLNSKAINQGPVLYWMSRDQRVNDNWSLLYAQELSTQLKQPILVMFSLSPRFLGATLRQYGFMLRGLQQVEKKLSKLNIPFYLLLGDPATTVLDFAKKHKVGAIITDFDPLKIKRKWQRKLASTAVCACFEVDSHNIVPCRQASSKQAFGAYILRPKIHKLLSEYLTDFPKLKKQSCSLPKNFKKIDWKKAWDNLEIDQTISEINWQKPGELAAQAALRKFLNYTIKFYEQSRNDPTQNAQSNLSPYLHFGQLSAQRVALSIEKSEAPLASKKAFLEELIIRKELSDNFCHYNSEYDSTKGFPDWAKITLEKHLKDFREYNYSLKILEQAQTHDALWNAAQLQMVKTGKMHGYMRMYWAKKILEWTKTPAIALKIAIYLNDKYEIDGNDPNGYTGIAWSIGGVHDRAWPERAIFGKIRFMNYKGCKSKFDVKKYISSFSS